MIDQERLKEIDVKNISRALLTYQKILDNHIKGNVQLPKETIEFIVEHMLEQILTLEDYANMIYDELTPEEKAILDLQEEKRNEMMYKASDGGPIPAIGLEYINRLKEAQANKYQDIRDKAKEKINPTQNPEI